ncbi:MAG: SGNH/GDSL hydrolase family protein [Lachnospiraceae bacterium]|nr:SGNH/GDSL hydrolase family protein [Lachnospiraceae bacterium]
MKDKKRLIQIAAHIGFFVFIIAIILIFVSKILNFINGNVISNDDIPKDNSDSALVSEPMDYILPLVTTKENLPVDDGKTTVVCFGNAPFADDRDSNTNICNLVAKETGATVYNCSIPGSYMAAQEVTFMADVQPMDAFSFYWLTTRFCMDNEIPIEGALANMEDPDPDLLKAVKLLESIDFEKVDVIAIMYDGSDYLAGRGDNDDENFTNPQRFTGSMAAGIELIQTYLPHIRIIVMSPTYAYALQEDGTTISSYLEDYGFSHLSTYVAKQADAAYNLSVSFVDNFFGGVYEKVAPDYLKDHIHLNEEGRKLVAEKLIYALELFPEPVVE